MPHKASRVPEIGPSHNLLPTLKIEYLATASLTPLPGSPRIHSKKQIRQIAKSIESFGFIGVMIKDRDNNIIVGAGRLEAAKLLGLETVPVISADHLTQEQVRALRVADNKLCENADWDLTVLGTELEYLTDFELTDVTGFDAAEVDIHIGNLIKNGQTKAEVIDEQILANLPRTTEAVSRLHDKWQLGRHVLVCDDARELEAFKRLMGNRKAQMIFIDPPFNVKISGHASGLGKIQHREFPMASGEMSEAEFIAFLTTVFRNLVSYSADGLIAYIKIDWRHLYEALTATRATFTELKNLVTWVKTNAGNGSFYRSQHELFLLCKVGTAPHVNNFGLGTHRYRTNVWSYPGANTMQVGRLEELALHPTVTPLALLADACKDCSHRGDIILDCCAGSGTSIIAAEVTGRCAYAMELDPLYVDTCIRRFQAYTGEDAIHIESDLTFNAREAALGGDHGV